ncbi:hypothetical protein M9H77_05851 [Catharanthus roseus]|uniref:Uncharacterized protein n=1 Tax=Catharanthus roseus TaxID=4058 RepID=A0ACC0BQH1_CATRO|nr:hypothetical protein M9H77_05851 [Catharanthus roseus]
MSNSPFPFSSSGFSQFESGYNSLIENGKAIAGERMQEKSDMEDWRDTESFCIKYGFSSQNTVEELPVGPEAQSQRRIQHQLSPSNLNIRVLPADQRMQDMTNIEVVRTGKFLSQARELTELFLGGHSSQFKRFRPEEVRNMNYKPCAAIQKLSTEKIMRIAGERFIEFSSQKFININMLVHPYGSALSHLTSEEKQDVELAQLLLAAAEKVSCQHYDRANKLLTQCELTASNTGSPAQRAIFYFAEALRMKIDRETGRSSPKRNKEKGNHDACCSPLRYNVAFLALHQEIPFTQIMHFTAVQAILENIERKSKVHVIDLEMRSGLQWAVLMQALAEEGTSPTKHLKITAVETADREGVEETGKSLQSFARSLNLQFSFKVVFLSDIEDLQAEHFDILPEEAVAVYASMALRTMISRPACLETLMRAMRSLNPSVMVVAEVEANHNSPCFINRFIDALFFYAAFFDCLEDNMKREDQYRMIIETLAFREGIHNILAAEGSERTTRSVKIEVWRSFFAKFGMVEIQLSEWSLYQAHLILQQFNCGSSYLLEMNGNCLLVGWKGTPIHSLSAWKFH